MLTIDFLSGFILGGMSFVVLSQFADLKRSQRLTKDMELSLKALNEQAKELISVAEQKRKEMFDKAVDE